MWRWWRQGREAEAGGDDDKARAPEDGGNEMNDEVGNNRVNEED